MITEHGRLTHADVSQKTESSASRVVSRGPCHRLPRCCARSPWALLSPQHHDDWQEEETLFPASVRNSTCLRTWLPKHLLASQSHFKMSEWKWTDVWLVSSEAPRSGGTHSGLIGTTPYSSSVAVSSPEASAPESLLGTHTSICSEAQDPGWSRRRRGPQGFLGKTPLGPAGSTHSWHRWGTDRKDQEGGDPSTVTLLAHRGAKITAQRGCMAGLGGQRC